MKKDRQLNQMRRTNLLVLAMLLFGLFASPHGAGAVTLDGFTPYADDAVYAMAVQTDGKVVLGGNFTTMNSTPSKRIARLNADGSVDTSFNPGTGANKAVWALALQADGKVVLGGTFTSVNNTTCTYIARLNANGSLDTGFKPVIGPIGVYSGVYSLAVQTNGKVLVGGFFHFRQRHDAQLYCTAEH